MSRYDDDYDRGRDPGRGRPDTYDDYDRGPRGGGGGGSGMIMAAAIINLVAGALILIFGVLLMIGGFQLLGIPFLTGRGRIYAIISALDGVLGLAIGGMAIPAGIGLLLRKSFGRTLGLIATYVACGYVVLELIRVILVLGSPFVGAMIFLVLVMLLAITMVIFNFIALYSSAARRLR